MTLHATLSFYYLSHFPFSRKRDSHILYQHFIFAEILSWCSAVQFLIIVMIHEDFQLVTVFVSFGTYIWGRAKGGSDKSISLGRETLWFQSCSYLIRSCFSPWLTSFLGIVSPLTSLKYTIGMFTHQKLTGISLILPTMYTPPCLQSTKTSSP